MDKHFIGREEEIHLLQEIMDSGKPEFVAVYGRRRVGKTYLIQQFFENRFAFSATGIIDGKKDEELFSFTSSLITAGYSGPRPRNWLEAFELLKQTLSQHPHRGRQVVYIDELPCFDTPKSGFVRALGYFWNTWGSLQKDLVLIVSGSATSWMMDNIIDNHGGLHDRTTHTIYLRQFNLSETERYLKAGHFLWPRQMIVETYMMLGGIPYYLSLLNRQESLAQNIDRLYFRKNAELSQEYRRLYSSLFKHPEPYVKIVESLAKNKLGLTRSEIATALKVPSSGTLTRLLENLVSCGAWAHCRGVYSWRSSQPPRAQVDMIIERADHLVNLCEIKYSYSEYTITASEHKAMSSRIAAFVRETKNRNGILPTWVTPYGLSRNEYSVQVQNQVTMDDLFA